MSSKNDSENAVSGMVVVGLVFAGLFLFFVFALLSLAMTVMCLTALKEERTYFGSTITPREAKLFIACGVIGAIVMALFVRWLDGVGMPVDVYHVYAPIVGYTIGSLAYGYGEASHQQQQEAAAKEAELMAPIAPPSGPSPYFMTVEEQEAQRHPPFRYASWDDEAR